MKKIKIQKISFIFITILLISTGAAKAETYSFSYTDPSLAPTGCNCVKQSDGSYYCDSNVGGLTCYNPNVIINASANLYFSNPNVPLSARMPTTYQVCSISSGGASCFDGKSSDVYSGKSSLVFTTGDTSSFTATGMTDKKEYSFTGCATGCQNGSMSIKSGESLTWDNNITTLSTPITLSQVYHIFLTLNPKINTRGTQSSVFNLQPFTISQWHTTSPDPAAPSACSTAAQANFCVSTIYFSLVGSTTQYKAGVSYNGSVIKSYTCNPDNVYGGSSLVTIYYEDNVPCEPKINTPPSVLIN